MKKKIYLKIFIWTEFVEVSGNVRIYELFYNVYKGIRDCIYNNDSVGVIIVHSQRRLVEYRKCYSA